MQLCQEIAELFPVHMRSEIVLALRIMPEVEEFRIRMGWPIAVCMRGREWIYQSGSRQFARTDTGSGMNWKDDAVIQRRDMDEMLSYISRYSLYAYEQELRNGFVTIRGGHRIGVAGQAILENGSVKNFSYITFLNIRVARQIRHCADGLIPYIRRKGRYGIYNTMIVSPPGFGKTTMLRECVRELSYGDERMRGMKIAVVDERSEIAACYEGIPQNDVGPRTDVIDGCPKTQGIEMMIRSMSPEIIAVDELGAEQDFAAVERAFTCGCSLLGTLHGDGVEDLMRKPWIERWLGEGRLQRIVCLERRQSEGESTERKLRIFDGKGVCLC